MMTSLSCDVLKALAGKTLSTAESCTGGGVGTALTAIAGSSEVYKGGVISYTDWVKETVLGVDSQVLCKRGAVSSEVAQAMATGVRRLLQTDIAISVTGLAGPGSDAFGNPVGTVYIGYCDCNKTYAKVYHFSGNRESVRTQAIQTALEMILQENTKKPLA